MSLVAPGEVETSALATLGCRGMPPASPSVETCHLRGPRHPLLPKTGIRREQPRPLPPEQKRFVKDVP